MTDRARATVAAFLYGNLVIGTGVMVLPGMLEHVAQDLAVPIAQAGQLITFGALLMCVGAPMVAAATSQVDRRRLLLFALGLFCVGHAACALAPSYGFLAVLRMLAVFGAAIFTPQAAATIGAMVAPERRAAAVTAIFAGWSIASVLGMPLGKLVAAYFGWRWGFALVALLALAGFVGVWRTTPAGLHVPALSLASWRSVVANRPLATVLAVTLVSGLGQFTLLSYIAPSLTALTAARPSSIAALFALFGVFGVIGNLLATRRIARLGADRAVGIGLSSMLLGLGFWALATVAPLLSPSVATMWALLLVAAALWGLGCFSSNSAQQARLVGIEPGLASASIALNTSSMYAGQAIGAALGGALVTTVGLQLLPFAATIGMAAALWLSLQVGTRVASAA